MPKSTGDRPPRKPWSAEEDKRLVHSRFHPDNVLDVVAQAILNNRVGTAPEVLTHNSELLQRLLELWAETHLMRRQDPYQDGAMFWYHAVACLNEIIHNGTSRSLWYVKFHNQDERNATKKPSA